MAFREGLLAGGAFIGGTAIAIHGGIEHFSDRANAYEQFSQAKSDADMVLNSLKAINPLPQNETEIPEDLRNQLYAVGSEYRDAQRKVDMLEGETFELSATQAKTTFNFGEILVGGVPLIMGYVGVNELYDRRKQKRFSQEEDARRMQSKF